MSCNGSKTADWSENYNSTKHPVKKSAIQAALITKQKTAPQFVYHFCDAVFLQFYFSLEVVYLTTF